MGTGQERWQPDGGFWANRPVAVTGATGFLGSHLTARLVDLGARVAILTRDRVPASPVTDPWWGAVSVVDGDLGDQDVLERLLGEYEIATAFHLAAQSQVGVANANPVSTFEANTRGTWNLLEAARRSPALGQLVVASTDKAYGSQPALPYTEDMPLLAVNPYDVSKACADLIAACYAKVFGVPAVVTRCGNLYGPGDTNEARLIPGTIRALLRGERPVLRSDGTMIRDYLFTGDAVDAYLCLAERLAQKPDLAGEAFNFATGQPHTVLEVVAELQQVMGTDLPPDIRATADHEIEHQYLASDKARELLGWTAHWDLAAGLAETVAWYRTHVAA